MAGFSDTLKEKYNLTDGDVKRIMALYYAFYGSQGAVDFIDVIDKLHKLGWHHDNEIAR